MTEPENTNMTVNERDNFFKLKEPYDTDKNIIDFAKRIKDKDLIKNVAYFPDEISGSDKTLPRNITGKTFKNVSFTKTVISNINFQKCVFEECLFIGSLIKDCEFHNCKFINTNTHKIKFDNVYVDPESFNRCLNPSCHQNIGVHLYQRLMRNFRNDNQAKFGRSATYEFYKWKMYQSRYEFFKNVKTKNEWFKSCKLLINFIGLLFWYILGAGVKLVRFMFIFLLALIVLSIVNFCLKEQLGLERIDNFVDSIYFTVITLTTIGYGDITPMRCYGKIVLALEGIIGFFLFAFTASILIRRIGQ